MPGDRIAAAGSTTYVYEGSTLIGQGITNAFGLWAIPLSRPEGTYSVTAYSVDADSTTSSTSQPMSFTVDYPPAVPVITYPTPGELVPGNTVNFRGTADPFTTIKISSSTSPIASTSVQADGSFSVTATMTDGRKTVFITSVDDLGVRSEEVLLRFSVNPKVPSPVRNLAVSYGPNPGDNTLTWRVPSFDGYADITKYRIYRGTATSPEVAIAEVDASTRSFTDTTCPLTKGYCYYAVSAVNGVRPSARTTYVYGVGLKL